MSQPFLRGRATVGVFVIFSFFFTFFFLLVTLYVRPVNNMRSDIHVRESRPLAPRKAKPRGCVSATYIINFARLISSPVYPRTHMEPPKVITRGGGQGRGGGEGEEVAGGGGVG